MTSDNAHDAESTALERLIDTRLSRRALIKAALAGAAGALQGGVASKAFAAAPGGSMSSLTFTEIAHGLDERHHLPPGYAAQVLLRSGDPLFVDAPKYEPGRADPVVQEKQFGFDNDFLAFMPLARAGGETQRGLLCSNHERSTAKLVWPSMTSKAAQDQRTADQSAHEMASQGMSIVELRQENGRWRTVLDSPFNRRITARSALIALGGPAAGHPRMRTSADPEGRRVIGTLNNCAGGVTPWGTVLTCEENIHNYFLGDPAGHPETAARKRYGINGTPLYAWGRSFERFPFICRRNRTNRIASAGWSRSILTSRLGCR